MKRKPEQGLGHSITLNYYAHIFYSFNQVKAKSHKRQITFRDEIILEDTTPTHNVPK